MDNTISKAVHDKKGRFVKGSCPNPKGSNQFTSLVPLIKALEKHGKKQKQSFWDMVAQRVWMNETVLIAVLKKVLPDKLQGEGFGNKNYIYVISNTKGSDKDRVQIPATSEPTKD